MVGGLTWPVNPSPENENGGKPEVKSLKTQRIYVVIGIHNEKTIILIRVRETYLWDDRLLLSTPTELSRVAAARTVTGMARKAWLHSW